MVLLFQAVCYIRDNRNELRFFFFPIYFLRSHYGIGRVPWKFGEPEVGSVWQKAALSGGVCRGDRSFVGTFLGVTGTQGLAC